MIGLAEEALLYSAKILQEIADHQDEIDKTVDAWRFPTETNNKGEID